MRLTADGRKFVRQAKRVLTELRAAGIAGIDEESLANVNSRPVVR